MAKQTATEGLIASQVMCIRQYIDDFHRESPNCPHHEPATKYCRKAQNYCQWESCPLDD